MPTQYQDYIETQQRPITPVRRRRKKRRPPYYLLILLIIVAIAFFAIRGIVTGLSDNGEPHDFQFQQIENMDIYTLAKKNYAFGIQYPVTADTKMNESILADVRRIEQNFLDQVQDYGATSTEDRAICKVDSKTQDEHDFLAVTYSLHQSLPRDEKSFEKIRTGLYHKQDGIRYHTQDIFDQSFLPFISKYIQDKLKADPVSTRSPKSPQFDTAIAENWDNFENFHFDQNVLILYFDADTLLAGSTMTIEVPLRQIYDMLKVNVTGYTPPPMLADPDKPMVALTFDDGPEPGVTERIVSLLKNAGGRATFFIMGNRVEIYADILKSSFDAGCEIGNHSFSHPDFLTLTDEQIEYEIEHTSSLVESVTGSSTYLVRLPYASANDNVRSKVRHPIINWNIDTEDWLHRDANYVAQHILERIEDGDIVIMHDLYATTAEACEIVVPELIRRGFQLVTVSEMMAAKGIDMKNGQTYTDALSAQ